MIAAPVTRTRYPPGPSTPLSRIVPAPSTVRKSSTLPFSASAGSTSTVQIPEEVDIPADIDGPDRRQAETPPIVVTDVVGRNAADRTEPVLVSPG